MNFNFGVTRVCCVRREVTSFAWHHWRGNYKDCMYLQNFLHEYMMSHALHGVAITILLSQYFISLAVL